MSGTFTVTADLSLPYRQVVNRAKKLQRWILDDGELLKFKKDEAFMQLYALRKERILELQTIAKDLLERGILLPEDIGNVVEYRNDEVAEQSDGRELAKQTVENDASVPHPDEDGGLRGEVDSLRTEPGPADDLQSHRGA